MANISGSVLFNRINSQPTTGDGIPNIPVVLQNTTTGIGLVVLTDTNGNYAFNNVPNASYRLVEAYGTTGGVSTPGNFTNATNITQPTPKDPPLSIISSPPATTTTINSITPNTLLITISESDSTGNNFMDGPVANIPIIKTDVTISPQNLITIADSGTFGTVPTGSAVNTIPPSAPYTGVGSGFTYIPNQTVIDDGKYTIINIWDMAVSYWRTADHGTGNETGRFLWINGSFPGSVFFSEEVTVKPNTYYLLSTWIMNINYYPGSALPQLGVKLLGSNGSILFNVALNDVAITTIPTWNEVGTLLNSGNNTTATLQIYSNGPAANGNDYCIDDVLLQEAVLATPLQVTETVNSTATIPNTDLTYTVVIKNIGQSTASNIKVSSTIPNGTIFKSNSVTINNTVVTALDPTPSGFTIPAPNATLASGQTITITFKTTITTIPNPNPIVNSTAITYDISPVPGGAVIAQKILSNEVSTIVNKANLSTIIKQVDKQYAECGNNLTYTIVIPNTGNVPATNVIFKDTIPNGTVFVSNSVMINNVIVPNANPQNGINVGTIPASSVSTINFTVQIQC